jgi:hypothetical protein
MLSTVFTFAPLALTEEVSPLAVAAELARRRQADNALAGTVTRHRISPILKKPVEAVALIAA